MNSTRPAQSRPTPFLNGVSSDRTVFPLKKCMQWYESSESQLCVRPTGSSGEGEEPGMWAPLVD